MNKENFTCPLCKGNETLEYLLNKKSKCFTCDGVGTITEQHNDLFELGFSEMYDDEVYYLQLQKKLNDLEDIFVQLKRVGENFVIHPIRIKSPYANAVLERIFNVRALVVFLKERKG